MPQVYNLGGLVLQRLDFLHVDRFKDSTGNYSFMEIVYDINSINVSSFQNKTPRAVILRNVEKIISKNGNVYFADNIQESGNQVSEP